MYKASPEPGYRPDSAASGISTGRIPAIAGIDSGVRIPDNNIVQFHNEKAREQWAINKQTYRTLPLIEPKPKVRRDWPMGSYMRLMEGPGWHEVPKTLICQDPSKLKVLNQYTENNFSDGSKPPGLVHLQYNSPINLYSRENVQNSLTPGQRGVSPSTSAASPASYGPVASSVSPQPHYNARSNQLGQPLNVDITQSPTYQFLQDERDSKRPGHSPKYSQMTGHHSPGDPIQTPYMKTLMHALHVSEH